MYLISILIVIDYLLKWNPHRRLSTNNRFGDGFDDDDEDDDDGGMEVGGGVDGGGGGEEAEEEDEDGFFNFKNTAAAPARRGKWCVWF